MSSSRRSSRRSGGVVSGPCPTCGSRRVVAVDEEIVLKVGRKRRAVHGVPHEHCLACGERIFGYDASRLLDDILLRHPSHRAA
jgi:YgiT-type zinc finger domain-containing protein